MYTDKNKGGITAFIIIVISFVSWAIFTASIMLSGEISVMKDREKIIFNEKREAFLEVIFEKIITDIDREISEENIKDIIWYFMEKDGKLMWTENYENFIKSDKGYDIYRIKTGDKIKDFSENTDIDFKDFIVNNPNLSSIEEQRGIIFFKKCWEKVYLEDSDEKYNLEIKGQIEIVLPKRENSDLNIMKSCKLEVLEIEIY